MREKMVRQMSIFHSMPTTAIGRELEAISGILDDTPGVVEAVYQELAKKRRLDTGREGMTAEQVLRCAILKQYRELTYEELAYHVVDSQSFRAFARLRHGQAPSGSTLQENIKALSAETWETLHRLFVMRAASHGQEKGRKVRLDSTSVESGIHYPLDSTLLQDGIRIITRWLAKGRSLEPVPCYTFSNHNRVVKKRVLTILNVKKEAVRKNAYQDLLRYAGMVRGYAMQAIPVLYDYQSAIVPNMLTARNLAGKLERAVSILDRVIDQTERRVMRGEKVPASDKVVSFFEDHTDILVKGGRDTQFGHKVFLAGGASSIILDCLIVRGNPTDAELFVPLVKRQKKIFGRVPRQVAADGGFASKDNLVLAKRHGVKDVSFAKKRGLSVLEMVKSTWVYKKLRNFRAGIEANISTLKRKFGLDRCTWKGWAGFQRYVWSSVVSYNLLVMARLTLAS